MLYIVATPIGNLMDISYRAIETLQQVDLIVAEDPKKSKILLNHYNIHVKTISLNEHNEAKIIDQLLDLLHHGKKIALISDAGTPLISDPGYRLVRQAHLVNIPTSPIPGASSVISAVSVSGLATDRFVFVGFLPSKIHQKEKELMDLRFEKSTMVFFESPRRVLETLGCMKQIFGIDREITFCRELTKKFETIKQDYLENIYDFVLLDHANQTKGEIVLVVAGCTKNVINVDSLEDPIQVDPNSHEILQVLLTELTLPKAASLTAKITGIPKKVLYKYGMSLPRKI